MKKIVSTLLIGLLGALAAHAQGTKSTIPELDDAGRKGEMVRLAQKKASDNFDGADEDKNGTLSRAEVAKHFPFFDQNFERYDKNKDGILGWEEFVGHDKWKRPVKDK